LFNGVSDASLVIFIIFFILFWTGPEVLQIELIAGNVWSKPEAIIAIFMIGIQGLNALR
jgi:hypothetical protein